MPLQVERAAAGKLVVELEARYAKHAETEIYNGLYRMYFVRDSEHYGLFNNSNMMAARWLREMDCTTCGWSMFSKFKRCGG